MSGRDECCREDTIKWIQNTFYNRQDKNITYMYEKA